MSVCNGFMIEVYEFTHHLQLKTRAGWKMSPEI